jgi:hypothetical protein
MPWRRTRRTIRRRTDTSKRATSTSVGGAGAGTNRSDPFRPQIEHALGHQSVKVDVGGERRAAPLNGRHGTTAALNALLARPAPLEGEQCAHEHGQHGAAEAVIVGEPVAQPVRQCQHPLADGQTAKDAVDEVGGERTHAPPAAGWAEPPPLAGKRDQNLTLAAGAAKARKAARHQAAGEKLAQFPFHESRQALTAAAQTCFGEKRLEVLADHLVQDGLLGPAADVRMAHSAERGVPGCGKLRDSDVFHCRAGRAGH